MSFNFLQLQTAQHGYHRQSRAILPPLLVRIKYNIHYMVAQLTPLSSGHSGRHGHEFLGTIHSLMRPRVIKLTSLQSSTFASLVMEPAHPPVMQTTPITAMTPSFAKRVCSDLLRPKHRFIGILTTDIVCVSSTMIEEIKRIIKTSEILK